MPLIHRGYKTELDPNQEQRAQFRRFAGCCRYVWNWGLEERREAWQERRESLTHQDQCKQLVELKREDGMDWLREPPHSALQATLLDLHRAFQHFFRRVENGETPGYPNFSKK